MEPACTGCRTPRCESRCGLCGGSLCRRCRIFLSEDELPFLSERPPELRHTYYCGACHDEKVEPIKSAYETTLGQARGINVIYKGSKSTIRVVRKATDAVRVASAPDRDEALLRLAFHAARAGYNAIIDVELSAQKVRNEGWQKSTWSGSGLPAQISSRELDLKS